MLEKYEYVYTCTFEYTSTSIGTWTAGTRTGVFEYVPPSTIGVLVVRLDGLYHSLLFGGHAACSVKEQSFSDAALVDKASKHLLGEEFGVEE